MRPLILAFVFAVPVLFAQTSELQHSSPIPRLTEPSNRAPQDVGFDYLASSSGLSPDDLSGVYLAKAYTSAHNGVTHLQYRQRFQGIDVYNAAWVANVAADGAVVSAGGTLYPDPGTIDFASKIPATTAVRAAVQEINPRLGSRYVPSEISVPVSSFSATPYRVRYAAGDFGGDIDGRLVWFSHRKTLLLAWVFNVVDEDGVSSYDVAVEAATGAIIAKEPTTFFQSAPRGLVFEQGWPQPNPTPGVRLNSPPPIVERKLIPFVGEPKASPAGWMINNETAGNNAVVGENLLGQSFLTNAYRTQAATGDFSFPLSLGPTAPSPLAFRDAANVNLFYWVNLAHDFFYVNGFDEAAGNFQSNNYGRGGAGGDALMAFTHFGAAANGGPALNNAFFSTRSLSDGGASMIAMYASSSGTAGFFADGAFAADVIIHEYTHGVSLRLLPDGYGSFQTSSMGEAWSDFFGLEFTIPPGSPADGAYPLGEYFTQSWGTGGRTRPYSSDTNINPLTYADLGHVLFQSPEVHADGEIWVEALWEARANLIQQLGETEGRRRIRQLVIDGLMLSPPSPTMVDARDAILLADRLDYEGASQDQLWRAFAKRGLGAFAHSDGGDTVHVISSFDVPSPVGKLRFYENTFVAGEPIRVVLSDSNLFESTTTVQLTTSSGDVEDLVLSRSGSVYFGGIPSFLSSVAPQDGAIELIPGDVLTATYRDAQTGFFLGGNVVTATASTQQPYAAVMTTTSTTIPTFPNEVRLTNIRIPVFVSLPFDFPFFSKRYRSMVVYPTGGIGFESSAFTSLVRPGCNDIFELMRFAGIAPLFANLTFGTAQQNEGIWLSLPAANTVAIRWSAEIIPTGIAVSPVFEPVNFAVVFNADGVITFHYGSGNQNLHTAAQTLSTCGAQPAVGLSNGHDVYVRPAIQRSYTNAPAITFYPPFNSLTDPVAILERPSPDEIVRGVMRVSGIAYDPGFLNTTFITRRDVFIDGVQRSVITAPTARTDYCLANQVPGCPFVGFQSELNLAALGLTAGKHSIFVRVTNTRGAFKDTDPISFTVDAAPARLPVGAIETPAAGAELSGTVDFSGYAYASDLRVFRVDLLIDGLTYPVALYGAPRPDICGTLPAPLPPNCPNVGWTLSRNTRTGAPPLPDGSHSMQLRVLDESGRYTLVPESPVAFTVKNGPQTFPLGAVTSIKPGDRLSGVIPISGYAYSTVGRVVSVVVLVDGYSVASAQYGQPRPEVCANLPAVAACPDIGFSVNLNTRILTNGSHVIGVRITNDSGLSTVVPNQVLNGMNVTIDNR